MEMIGPEIKALLSREQWITLEELKALRCNSWEWEAIVPKLDDEAFLYQLQYAVDNCMLQLARPYATYPDAVVGLYVPELMKRFREVSEDRDALVSDQSG